MSVLSDLERLHAAEDFFSYLKVDFDPKVVAVARLHILKRMGKYLAEQDFSAASEEEVFAMARTTLSQAYADFLASRPIDERVFKVLQDHDPQVAKPNAEPQLPFVPLDALVVVGS